MGNGCCSGDRKADLASPENSHLQELLSACKNVEFVLPRLEKETNRTRQALNYLTAETEAVDSELQDSVEERRKLLEELERSTQSPGLMRQRSNRGLQRTLSGRVIDPAEVLLTHVIGLNQRVSQMTIRFSKAQSQLEINVQNSLKVLLADLQALQEVQEPVLKSGIANEKELAAVSSVSRPGALLSRLFELGKELEAMENVMKSANEKAFAREKGLETAGRELALMKTGLEANVQARIMEEPQAKEPIFRPPARRPPSIESTPVVTISASPRNSAEEFYLQQLQTLRDELNSEQERLIQAERGSVTLRNSLNTHQKQAEKAKAQVIVNVWRLLESRIGIRTLGKWKLRVEQGRMEEELRTYEVKMEKMGNRRKFTRLMQVISKFHTFSQERYWQKWKETQIRLSYKGVFSPTEAEKQTHLQPALNKPLKSAKPSKMQAQALLTVFNHVETRILRETVQLLRKLHRYNKGMRILKQGIWPTYSQTLISALIALKSNALDMLSFGSPEASNSSLDEIGETVKDLPSLPIRTPYDGSESSDDAVHVDEGKRRTLVHVGQFKRSTTVQFSRTSL